MSDPKFCPDCGTSPMRDRRGGKMRMCGWPCGMFGFAWMLRKVQARTRHFQRTRAQWWRP